MSRKPYKTRKNPPNWVVQTLTGCAPFYSLDLAKRYAAQNAGSIWRWRDVAEFDADDPQSLCVHHDAKPYDPSLH